MLLRRRKRARLRPLSETEAYARCHGDRDEDVKIVSMERKKRPRFATTVSGERLRSMFEQRLDSRVEEPDPDAAEPAPEAETAQADVEASTEG
jgi:hypothetical protein